MRFTIIITLFVLFWMTLIFQIYQISIKSNSNYERQAQSNVEKKYFMKPIRGEILDRNGKLLAVNDIGFSIKVAPHLKKDGKILNSTLDSIVKEFPDLNRTKLFKKYKKVDSFYNHRFIPIVDFISYDDMIGAYPKLTINKYLKIESETKRLYPAGSMATHVVGYVGRSNEKENIYDREKNAIETKDDGSLIGVVETVGVVGKSGLEKYYNKVLQGELGYRIVKVTATNKEVAEIERKEPIEDQNLILHLDLDLQKKINELFVGQAGVAIVMKTNGDIIGAVSYPSYDPNLFVGGISTKEWKALINDFNHPFTNKIVAGTYPPGSAIKMGMALSFSKAGTSLDKTEHCRGFITIGKNKHKFRCWSHYGHGKVDLRKAIRESCDVYFYNKSLQTGINAMAKTLHEIGLGVKTGVDLPREKSGLIPDKMWKQKRLHQSWYQGETVISSIGQGYDLATPLQIARYTAFLATGLLPTPHFAKSVAGKEVPSEFKSIEVNEKDLNTIRLGMYDVCNSPHGTARRTMSGLPIVVAGKTGTSQVISIPRGEKKRMKEHEMDYYSRSHAWLTTYAPFKDPEYVVTVLVEHGGHGGSTSGPIAAEIYKWMANEGYFGEKFKGKVKMKKITKPKEEIVAQKKVN
jgi:penicillin-binding protein 2